MSGSVSLEIVTGADWATQISWDDGTGTPISFSNPMMDIRQDYNPTSPLLLRLDTTGEAAGLIQITQPGVMVLTIPASVTKNLTPSSAFWDLYVTTSSSQLARLLFGNVVIRPHVTVTS